MRIRTVDAFAARPYTGNPAAVVLLGADGFLGEDRLQTLAAEMNLAETAFAHPLPDDPEADWALRWFTPTTEVDLCGHATLATAHLLAADGLLGVGERVRFRTRGGVLGAVREPDGTLTLDFPTAEPVPVPVPDGAARALGTEPSAAWDTGTLGMLVLELADEPAVRALSPDPVAVAALPSPVTVVTAAATPSASSAGHPAHDFVSRVFAPAQGIPEDPVTGSAHTALAPLWSRRLGRNVLTGLQASRRTGYVRTTLRGDRTLLGGSAVTVLDATLRTPL
ncbi:PhzF family phenazine biosynthesis protein [Streptomyces albus subsp. chlorinus]|uniref:PhzF family phenazine biosynthesis protein n=1 Tax=Streptomyces albus TaxID=1888 RepID=UPI00156E64B2|nr:PhzF family phenazine biosynthesis protein [Streptomyces albus]NSC20446.1 PhzF family phenazine biosynthesis protein [Streptomyces albus subsp. chlorinus]